MTLRDKPATSSPSDLSPRGTDRPLLPVIPPSLSAALMLIVLTRWESYLLFHSIAELFGIVVAFGVFIVAWNSVPFAQNSYLLLLGIGTLFVASIDVLHMLSFKGMGAFPAIRPTCPPSCGWPPVFLQAGAWLIAPFFLKRTLKKYPTLILLRLITAGGLASILVWPIFPTAYVESVGLTPFKIGSECIIIAMLIGAMALLWRNPASPAPGWGCPS